MLDQPKVNLDVDTWLLALKFYLVSELVSICTCWGWCRHITLVSCRFVCDEDDSSSSSSSNSSSSDSSSQESAPPGASDDAKVDSDAEFNAIFGSSDEHEDEDADSFDGEGEEEETKEKAGNELSLIHI